MRAATESADCKVINASYDPIEEWVMDPAGYFLIRINEDKLEIGFCKEKNIILVKIIGDTAEEVYNTVLREKLTSDPSHLAYLGKELEKAEIARELGIAYVQDSPLDLSAVKR